MNARQLIQNAIYIPSEDLYLKSVHVHDYVSHEPREGYSWSVDGGLDYLRCGWGPTNKRDSFEDWSLYEDDPFERIAERFLWGTYGKPATFPMRYRPIASFTLDHLQAILATQQQIKGKLVERVVQHWVTLKT
jgi:hypothetical protein